MYNVGSCRCVRESASERDAALKFIITLQLYILTAVQLQHIYIYIHKTPKYGVTVQKFFLKKFKHFFFCVFI
jgi:hypothetical protein